MKSTMPKAEGDNDLLLDDSEDGGFDLDDSEDGEANLDDVGSDAASVSEAPESDAEPMSDMGDDEDGDLELAEGSDAEDLLDLDADVPVGLIEFDGSDAQSDEEEWSGVASAPSANKRKRGVDDRRENRKKLRALPTFASAEDYAKLIDEGPEDNI
jgi:ribosome biogenesis protein MAK21